MFEGLSIQFNICLCCKSLSNTEAFMHGYADLFIKIHLKSYNIFSARAYIIIMCGFFISLENHFIIIRYCFMMISLWQIMISLWIGLSHKTRRYLRQVWKEKWNRQSTLWYIESCILEWKYNADCCFTCVSGTGKSIMYFCCLHFFKTLSYVPQTFLMV